MDTFKKFTILFSANTQALEAGVKKTEGTLKTFGKFFGGLVSTYFSYKIFDNVINGFVDFNMKLSQNTSLMGYNAEQVQAL